MTGLICCSYKGCGRYFRPKMHTQRFCSGKCQRAFKRVTKRISKGHAKRLEAHAQSPFARRKSQRSDWSPRARENFSSLLEDDYTPSPRHQYAPDIKSPRRAQATAEEYAAAVENLRSKGIL